MKETRPKFGAVLAGIALVAGIGSLGYMFASGKPLNHGVIFIVIIAGLILSDGSFWPNRPR